MPLVGRDDRDVGGTKRTPRVGHSTPGVARDSIEPDARLHADLRRVAPRGPCGACNELEVGLHLGAGGLAALRSREPAVADASDPIHGRGDVTANPNRDRLLHRKRVDSRVGDPVTTIPGSSGFRM